MAQYKESYDPWFECDRMVYKIEGKDVVSPGRLDNKLF